MRPRGERQGQLRMWKLALVLPCPSFQYEPNTGKWTTNNRGISIMKSMKSTRLGIYLGLMIIGQLARAADPIETWTSTDTKVHYDLIAVAYGTGQYVAVGGRGIILSSPDGTSWTQRTSGTTNSLRSIVYGGGQFVAVGGDEHDPNRKAIVVTSKDGLSWSLRRPFGSALNLKDKAEYPEPETSN